MSAPVDPPSALRLGYGPLEVESPEAARMALAGDSSVELFVDADFFVEARGRLLYHEVDFTVLELAVFLHLWLRGLPKAEEDFVYTSTESAEEGNLWIKKADAGWRVGSVHQEYEETTVFDLREVRLACEAYVDRLKFDLLSQFGIDITNLLRTGGGRLRT